MYLARLQSLFWKLARTLLQNSARGIFNVHEGDRTRVYNLIQTAAYNVCLGEHSGQAFFLCEVKGYQFTQFSFFLKHFK